MRGAYLSILLFVLVLPIRVFAVDRCNLVSLAQSLKVGSEPVSTPDGIDRSGPRTLRGMDPVQVISIFHDPAINPHPHHGITYPRGDPPSVEPRTLSPAEVVNYDGSPRVSSYSFTSGPSVRGYRVGQGDRVQAPVPQGQSVVLGSTGYFSCAGFAVRGTNSSGQIVLLLAHIEEVDSSGQLNRMRSEVNRMHNEGIRNLNVFVSIDPNAQSPVPTGVGGTPEANFFNFPRDEGALRRELGGLVTRVRIERGPLDDRGHPEMRNVYVTPEGVTTRSPSLEGGAPRFMPW